MVSEQMRLWGNVIFLAVLAAGVGCGARTDTLEFDDGLTGTGGVSGNLSHGGTSTGATGGHNVAGFPNVGGTSFGGIPNVGGTTSFGGTSFGGFPNVGGTTSFGGFGAVAGTSVAGSTNHQECDALSTNACGQCQCNACYTPLVGCITDGGCGVIFSCALQKGCFGPDCYKPSTCESVIDAFGGPGGASVRAAIGLVSCIATSACGSCGL